MKSHQPLLAIRQSHRQLSSPIAASCVWFQMAVAAGAYNKLSRASHPVSTTPRVELTLLARLLEYTLVYFTRGLTGS